MRKNRYTIPCFVSLIKLFKRKKKKFKHSKFKTILNRYMDTLLDEEKLLFVLSPFTSNNASLRRIMKVQFGHFMIKTQQRKCLKWPRALPPLPVG